MSDHSQDTVYPNPSVAKDLTKAINLAGISGRLFTELVNLTEAKSPLLVPVKSAKIAPKLTPRLSPVHQANSAKEISILLSPLISERLTLLKLVTKNLKV